MKYLNCLMILMFVFGCKGKDRIEDMQAIVPVYDSGKIIQTQNLPDQNMSIIQYEVNAAEASEENIIRFYKDIFAKKGWKLQEMKNYAGNGSVFSFIDESATVSIQTITKEIKDGGTLKVILNLSRQGG